MTFRWEKKSVATWLRGANDERDKGEGVGLDEAGRSNSKPRLEIKEDDDIIVNLGRRTEWR